MKNKIIAISCVVAIALVTVIAVALAAPGTNDDPIVSLSYVEQRLSQVQADLNAKINDLQNAPAIAASTFTVVEVQAGQKLVADEGTEMILRQGSATVFATQKGGLANTTSGVDLQDGSAAPANSLLICPLPDGRGLKANTYLLVMVKGKYTLN